MSARPRVSILLPARDAEATLGAALHGVTRQRFDAFECIVVDDGSADRTRAVAEGAAARDPRLRVVGGEGRGLVPALERGLAECRGEFVARMDADDWMHRDRLGLQVARLVAEPGLAAVGTHVRLFPRPLTDGMRQYENWLNSLRSADDVAANAFIECPVAHPTMMIRRSVIDRFRYREAGWPEDYDLVLRLLAAGERIGIVDRRLHGWRDAPGRLSRTDPVYRHDRFTACKARFLADGFLAGSERYVLCGYGDTGRALRGALAAHGRTPACIVDVHPGRIGNAIHGAPVVSPEALAQPTDLPIIGSVAGEGPRTALRRTLAGMGYREGEDFICAA